MRTERYKERYRLVPYQQELDAEDLFRFYTDPDEMARVGYPLPLRSREEVARFLDVKLKSNWREFYVLENSKGERLGFGFSHDHRTASCCLSLAIYPRFQASGAGAVLAVLMLEHLFNQYPINRVYEHVFDHNTRSLRLHSKPFIKCHGYLEDQGFYNGRTFGTYIFSIERSAFEQLMEKEDAPPRRQIAGHLTCLG